MKLLVLVILCFIYSYTLSPSKGMDSHTTLILVLTLITGHFIKKLFFNLKRKRRRDYYRKVYLKSEAWKRKRYVVFKRDNWTCVHCGDRATQVHHTRYAKKNIGKEPIDWLESDCASCHEELHCQ